MEEIIVVLDEMKEWGEEIRLVEPSGSFCNNKFFTWNRHLMELAISMVHGVVAAWQVATAEGGVDSRIRRLWRKLSCSLNLIGKKWLVDKKHEIHKEEDWYVF